MDLTLLFSALLIGIMGSSHCLGMCGGLSAAIGSQNQSKLYTNLLGYNLGRIFSYSLAGFLFGWLGLMLTSEFKFTLNLLRLLAGILLVLMGLYIARISLLLVSVEKLFVPLWRLLQPLAQRSLQPKGFIAKVLCGMLWGWLPCGLVYSTLAWSATSANPLQASLLMLCFGLGTLPAMFLTSSLSNQFNQLLKNKRFKQVSGLLIVLYGLHTIYIVVLQHSPI